jgi:hypothetical protein
MTQIVKDIYERKMGIVYDGTNSAQIDALITQFDIISESSGVLTFESAGAPFVANTGEHVIYFQGMVFNVFNTATYNNFYTEAALQDDFLALMDTVNDLADTVAGISTDAIRAAGATVCPALLLNTAQDVAVTISPAMPSGSYTPHAMVWGGINLSSVTINSVTATSASVITVNLQTSLLSLSGVNLLVTATS